jgi:hypothetical protein
MLENGEGPTDPIGTACTKVVPTARKYVVVVID